jgi:hypothetical protein
MSSSLLDARLRAVSEWRLWSWIHEPPIKGDRKSAPNEKANGRWPPNGEGPAGEPPDVQVAPP